MAGNYEDGAIEVDYDVAKRQLDEMRSNLESLVSDANNAIDSLIELQELVHDVDGTAMVEDYKDLEVLYGESGMKKYVDITDTFIENIENGLQDLKNVTGA